jgi:glycosyltransferase involved in cell wall biosynthesis
VQGNKKIKVIHFGAGNLFGGIEVMLVTMAKFQCQIPGLDQNFAFFFEGKAANRIRSHGCPVKIFPETKIKSITGVLKVQRLIREYLLGECPEIVIVHGQWVHFIVAKVAKSLGIRFVHWSHDPPSNGKLIDWYIKIRKPDFFICNSEFTKRQCNLFLRNVNKFVIHCPVEDLTNDKILSQDSKAFREKWQTGERDLVFLHVARWEPHKGHMFLLEAAARVLKKCSDWKVWFVGETQRAHEISYRQAVVKRVIELGLEDQIRFLGWQEDLSKVIRSSDVYCQPNISPEPFGISIIEAMYFGLPVIVTPLGGPEETVDATCGRLVHSGDAVGLEGAMVEMFDKQKRKTLGANGKNRAAFMSSPKRQLEKFLALIS